MLKESFGEVTFQKNGSMLVHHAFKLQVHEGRETEFNNRFKDIWPELTVVAHAYGVRSLFVYLDEKSNQVFCSLWCESDWNKEALLGSETFLLWRLTMQSLLDTDDKMVPKIEPLCEVFSLKLDSLSEKH